ncbi:LysR family transcriptional regulator [Brevibacterium sp. FME37]|uniref:LysR family transcriptional regulator n=1 Tax=Brevibacterium sp. FME37 TaxID=2742607 RepID=UPI0018691FCF|nr:LysR family transcriptional regulator [Brevibacterium sp. FME37]
MDLVEACRTFTAVSELGSMTLGAAADGVPQPVASRRIAGLERQFGARLFERIGRGVSLTPFGRDMLPSAARLVELADEMMLDADRAKLRPVSLAVPDLCSTRNLAVLAASANARGLRIDFHPGPPGRRVEDLTARRVRAALRSVPAAEGRWTVQLGCAHRSESLPAVRVADLRRSRAPIPGSGARLAGRRLRLLNEDDVPHVRGRIRRASEEAGLLPYQVVVGPSDPAAVAGVLADGDLLICHIDEARQLGLSWSPLVDPVVERGYVLSATSAEDASALGEFGEEIADCLGGTPNRASEAEPASGETAAGEAR